MSSHLTNGMCFGRVPPSGGCGIACESIIIGNSQYRPMYWIVVMATGHVMSMVQCFGWLPVVIRKYVIIQVVC